MVIYNTILPSVHVITHVRRGSFKDWTLNIHESQMRVRQSNEIMTENGVDVENGCPSSTSPETDYSGIIDSGVLSLH